jgi:ferredoxin-type protein NapH
MSWFRMHRYWILRRSTQIGILVLFWLGANHHLGILTGNLSSSRVLRTIPLADPYAVIQILATGQTLAATVLAGALIILLFYLVVGGRSFCAWVCPVDLLRGVTDASKKRLRLGGQFRVARSTRYWLMVMAIPLSAATGLAAFEWLSPIGVIQRELIFGPGLGLLVIAALVLADLFLLRDGWCGSLCPLGAFYSLLGRFALLRVGFDAERCDHCCDCVSVCPEKHVINLPRMEQRGFIDSGDCLNCARCLEVCPRDAYQFRLRPTGGAASRTGKGEHDATQQAA